MQFTEVLFTTRLGSSFRLVLLRDFPFIVSITHDASNFLDVSDSYAWTGCVTSV